MTIPLLSCQFAVVFSWAEFALEPVGGVDLDWRRTHSMRSHNSTWYLKYRFEKGENDFIRPVGYLISFTVRQICKIRPYLWVCLFLSLSLSLSLSVCVVCVCVCVRLSASYNRSHRSYLNSDNQTFWHLPSNGTLWPWPTFRRSKIWIETSQWRTPIQVWWMRVLLRSE